MTELSQLKSLVEDKAQDAESKINPASDFGFLCSKLGYGLMRNVNVHSLQYQGRVVCDVLVVAHDNKEGNLKFDAEHLDVNNEKLYVGVVCYDGSSPKDAYMISAQNFKSPGLLSIFGYDKKRKKASVKVGNKAKLEQYSFGNVVKNI